MDEFLSVLRVKMTILMGNIDERYPVGEQKSKYLFRFSFVIRTSRVSHKLPGQSLDVVVVAV